MEEVKSERHWALVGQWRNFGFYSQWKESHCANRIYYRIYLQNNVLTMLGKTEMEIVAVRHVAVGQFSAEG